jgi:hypothetical protein
MVLSMPLRRKLKTFMAMRGADRLLVCEAIVILALARLIILTVPLRYMMRWLTHTPKTDSHDKVLLLRVRRAVTTAADNVPWNAVCLPQAMAAKIMLARRGCRSSLHLGADFDGQSTLTAHAWLVAGDIVVLGAAGIPGKSPFASFG